MPRPCTPTSKARLTGADKKHPERFKGRSEPATSVEKVGDPPAYMDKDSKAAWLELAHNLGWLKIEGRGALEAASLAIGQTRAMCKADEPVTAAKFSALTVALGKLGATPVDRATVAPQGRAGDGDDPFAQFDKVAQYFS